MCLRLNKDFLLEFLLHSGIYISTHYSFSVLKEKLPDGLQKKNN